MYSVPAVQCILQLLHHSFDSQLNCTYPFNSVLNSSYAFQYELSCAYPFHSASNSSYPFHAELNSTYQFHFALNSSYPFGRPLGDNFTYHTEKLRAKLGIPASLDDSDSDMEDEANPQAAYVMALRLANIKLYVTACARMCTY